MANEEVMIPCPYNCKQGVHPRGSQFCPFTGKPIPKPPPITIEDVEEPARKIAKEPRDTIEKSPGGKSDARNSTGNKKKILVFIIPSIVICVIAVIALLNTGISSPPDNNINPKEKKNETVITKTYAYDQLPAYIKSGYQRQLAGFGWKTVTLDKKVNTTVDGMMDLRLAIDEKGKITDFNYSASNLRVTPQSKKQEIISTVKSRLDAQIHNRDLTPKKDEKGAKIKVTDFPFTVNIRETVKTLLFSDLPTNIKTKVEFRTGEPTQFPVDGNIDVRGEVGFFLTIDEKGKCRIQKKAGPSSLEVSPLSEKQTVIRLARDKVPNLTFEPLHEDDGTLLKITDVPITVIPRPVKIKEFKELAAGTIQAYETQLDSPGEIPIDANISVEGQVMLRLAIDEYGKITIERFDDHQLQVTPQAAKSRITNMINTKIQSHPLTPQTANGAFLRITNFLLTVRVSMAQGQLVLERLREF